MGIGYGQCIMYHVGGVLTRTLNFAVGEAISAAQNCLRLSELNKGIILSNKLWKSFEELNRRIQQFMPELDGIEQFKAYQIHMEGHYKIESDIEVLEEQIDEAVKQNNLKRKKISYYSLLRREIDCLNFKQRDRIWPEIEKYIPNYFRNYLDVQKQEKTTQWKAGIKQGNYNLTLSILALTLELEGAFESEDALFVLQTTIEIIQKQVYKMGGSLSKVSYDGGQSLNQNGYEGGLQIVAEWGLFSLHHYDSPTRACIAALNIQKAVKEFILLSNLD